MDLAGYGSDYGKNLGIAVDPSGNAYVVGSTASSDWVSGGWDTTFNGSHDGYVVKLSPSGAHVWSTYLGGANDDFGHGITVDDSGNVYVCGDTRSPNWVSDGGDTVFNGQTYARGFVVKLSTDGVHEWSTYIAGTEWEAAFDIALDINRNVYVTGVTETSGWPSGGWDTSYNGSDDAYVVKLSATGVQVWSTYLGGPEDDMGFGIGSGNRGLGYELWRR
jgi:hypothetical protein